MHIMKLCIQMFHKQMFVYLHVNSDMHICALYYDPYVHARKTQPLLET